MRAQEKWDELIAYLAVPCNVLNEKISARDKRDISARILLAVFQKGIDTLRAIQLLYSASFPIQAQVLVRVLIELRMDLEIFLRLLDENPEQAALRILDTMMLEKIKQQRQSYFRGWELVEGALTPDNLLEREQALIEVYGKCIVSVKNSINFDCFMFCRIGSGYRDIIELISSINLRQAYNLTDGLPVEVTISES